jgi:opacity protein-like surface antigen
MKKYMTIFLVFFFFSGAYAQQLKILGGPMISNYTERWPREGYWIQNAGFFRNPFQNSKTGFLAGIGIEFALEKNVAVETDGLYFHKGSSFLYTWPTPTTLTEEIYDMHGVSFPILLKIKFIPRPFPYLLGGVELSFIFSHARVTKQTGASISRGTWENISENTAKADFGLVFGMGFEMKVSKALFFFEGRYNLGQENLYKGHVYITERPRIKTCALEILTGFKI